MGRQVEYGFYVQVHHLLHLRCNKENNNNKDWTLQWSPSPTRSDCLELACTHNKDASNAYVSNSSHNMTTSTKGVDKLNNNNNISAIMETMTMLTNDPGRARAARALSNKVKSTLSAALPSYMLPRAIVIVTDIPLTSNGKVDRRGLSTRPVPRRALSGGSNANGATTTKQDDRLATTVEKNLMATWAVVLDIDVESIGIYDNFFALGGDSLVSLKLVGVASRAGMTFNVRQLFEHPTIAALAAVAKIKIKANGGDNDNDNDNANGQVTKEEEEEEALFVIQYGTEAEQHAPFALLGMQQAYWIGQQYITSLLRQQASMNMDMNMMEEDLPYYSPHVYLEYDIHGYAGSDGVFYNTLEHVVNTLVARHGMLRAIITDQGTAQVLKKVPRWTCTEKCNSTTSVGDNNSSSTSSALRTRMTRIGPTTDTWPLFEVAVSNPTSSVPLTKRIHISISLFCVDGTTEQIFRSEVAKIAQEQKNGGDDDDGVSGSDIAQLAPIGLSFRDYSTSVQALRQHPRFARSLSYWRERLPKLPTAPSGTLTF